MKLTIETLCDKVDEALIWRKRELTSFRAAVESARLNPLTQAALLRAGVALLYAHWEGFVKQAGSYYLEFVSDQRLKASELRSNFIAIKLKSEFEGMCKSEKASVALKLVDFFRNNMESRLHIPTKGVVDTKSNLSSTVLKDITWSLGLSMSPYETKCKLIDSSLVAQRNHIAHGNHIEIRLEDYLLLHDEVIGLISEFSNQVQNAASVGEFKLEK